MYARSVIFLSCLSKLIIVTNGGKEDHRIGPGKATDETVQSLLEISAVEALPIILIQEENSSQLGNVAGLQWAEIEDGRLATGTQFYSRFGDRQFFFCPKSEAQSSKHQCLAPMKFEESQSQPLQCEYEPIPTVLDHYQYCGSSTSNTYLKFSYEICPAEETYTYRNEPHPIYFMCYDTLSKRMLYVVYFFNGTGLLGDKLFTREREIKFEMNTKTYGLIDDKYYDNLVAEIQTNRHQYVLQQLVPTDDMALATSRKTTVYFANLALQHGALFDLWNEIIKYFRDHAIASEYDRYARHTGVFEIPASEITISAYENQKINVWFTIMIYYEHGIPAQKLAVLMNNFIINDPNNQSAGKFIDKLCGGKNYCHDNLKKKFDDRGVQGRCCQVTKEISNLYNGVNFTVERPPLFVKNITY